VAQSVAAPVPVGRRCDIEILALSRVPYADQNGPVSSATIDFVFKLAEDLTPLSRLGLPGVRQRGAGMGPWEQEQEGNWTNKAYTHPQSTKTCYFPLGRISAPGLNDGCKRAYLDLAATSHRAGPNEGGHRLHIGIQLRSDGESLPAGTGASLCPTLWSCTRLSG
jgi:hypothetical protein